MSNRVSPTRIFVRSLSEGMYVFGDPDLQWGKNNALVVVAPDRAHPYFEDVVARFQPIEADLQKTHHLKLFLEDHPGGYLHEKFACDPQEFHCYLIDREGKILIDTSEPISEA